MQNIWKVKILICCKKKLKKNLDFVPKTEKLASHTLAKYTHHTRSSHTLTHHTLSLIIHSHSSHTLTHHTLSPITHSHSSHTLAHHTLSLITHSHHTPLSHTLIIHSHYTLSSHTLIILSSHTVKSDLIFYPGGEGGQPPLPAVRPEQVQREVIYYFVIGVYFILYDVKAFCVWHIVIFICMDLL